MVDNDRVAAALPSYEVGTELGRGACGVVLGGRHRQLGRLVAIKQLPRAFGADPAVRARFLAEARVLATLDHPHVVAIYDFVDEDGLCLLVMERLTGGTVWSRFHAGGFTPDVSCAILLAVCAGLHHAHQHGILHRDVKPENLMFSGEGTLKVTDLGIAKVIGGSSTLATRHGEILGTPAYIAPEQAQGYELTPATDVYAAGTLLYELLAGRLPFPADTDPATLVYRHVHEAPPPLLEVAHAIPADLAAVADRALSKAPADRYQSAEAFGVAIAQCAARTWGRGWLARTAVPVSASAPVMTAAMGEDRASDQPVVPTAVESAQPTSELNEPVAGDFLPIQLLHPEYRADDASPDAQPAEVVPHAAAPTIAPAPAPAAAATAPPAATPAPASATIVDAGGRGEPGSSGAGGAPPPEVPSVGGPDSGGGRRAAPRRRRGLLVIVVAIVVVGALVAAAIAISGNGSSKPSASKTGGTLSPSSPAHPLATATSLWKALPSAPTARQQVASAVWNGSLWVMGGLTAGASTAKVESYDPVIQTWTAGPDLPLPLHHAMGVTYNNQLVVLGGWVPVGADIEGTASKRVYTLSNGKWVELPPMLKGRAAGAAAVVGNKIVVAGGQANHQLVTDTEVFDGTKWTEGAPIPTPRDHLAAVSDGHYFYAIGGRHLSADLNSSAFERYDPAANKWQTMPRLPTSRGGLGATVVGNEIVTAGGESPTGVYDSVEAFNLSTSTWSVLPPMKTPRHGLALLAVGKTVYAIDGAGASGHTDSVATNEALDLSSWATPDAWRTLPSSPTARQQVASTVWNGLLWIMGGLTAGTSTVKVESYDPVIQTWTAGPSLPLPLHHAMGTTYHGRLVVLGGWVPVGANIEGTASKRVFTLANGKWVELPPMLKARAAGAVAVVGTKIIVVGGQANHELVTDTEVFDGTKWTEGAPIPTPRDHLAAVADSRYFYAIGGRDLSADKNSAAFERYDPATNKWEELPGLPTARGGLGATLVGNEIITAGGESPTGVFGNVEAFNLSTSTWSILPPMKTPRHGLALLSVGNTIYAIDGAGAAGHTDSVNTNETLAVP